MDEGIWGGAVAKCTFSFGNNLVLPLIGHHLVKSWGWF